MQKIHIITDSASDISKELANDLSIEIIPITITFDGKTVREFYDIEIEEYWDILENSTEIPKTSQTTPANYYDAFLRAKENGATHIIAVIINSQGSGSFGSANIGRDMFYEEHGKDMIIELLDSRTYSYIYGHWVIEIAKMRNAGKSFDEILEYAKKSIARAQGCLGVYKLKHLAKSGRISGGAAFVGEALGLKPISKVGDGTVEVIDKARGVQNLLKKMAEFAASNSGDKAIAIIGHGKIPAEDINFLEALLKESGFKHVDKCKIGASVLTNAGPYSIGVFYYRKDV